MPARLPRLLVNLVLPLLAYLLLHGAIGPAAALAVSGGIPVLWTLGLLVTRRRADPVGLIVAAIFAVSLVVTVETGGRTLPLKLGHAVLTGGIGLVCLLSAAVGRPLLLLLPVPRGRMPQGAAGPGAPAPDPGRSAALTAATVWAGLIFLADAATHVMLALNLPTGRYIAVAHVVTLASLAAVALLVRRTWRVSGLRRGA